MVDGLFHIISSSARAKSSVLHSISRDPVLVCVRFCVCALTWPCASLGGSRFLTCDSKVCEYLESCRCRWLCLCVFVCVWLFVCVPPACRASALACTRRLAHGGRWEPQEGTRLGRPNKHKCLGLSRHAHACFGILQEARLFTPCLSHARFVSAHIA